MQLNTKENSLLKDLKDEEQVCAEKYSRYSQAACDPQLKDLFNKISGIERKHYDTLTAIGNGQIPSVNGKGESIPAFQAVYGVNGSAHSNPSCLCGINENDCECVTNASNHDKFLCSDLLNTEKHASHLYDSCIFEFKDENIRQVLNHIQKEEQEHGKMLYDYMSANGMY